MKKIAITLLVIPLLLTSGCKFLEQFRKGQDSPPRVNTSEVTKSLEETRADLIEAGKSNAAIEQKIDTALSLTERLEKLLTLIEQQKAMLQ
jgi:hypothetical protein